MSRANETTVFILKRQANGERSYYLTDQAQADQVVSQVNTVAAERDALAAKVKEFLAKFPNAQRFAMMDMMGGMMPIPFMGRGMYCGGGGEWDYLKILAEKKEFETAFQDLGLSLDEIRIAESHRPAEPLIVQELQVTNLRPGEKFAYLRLYHTPTEFDSLAVNGDPERVGKLLNKAKKLANNYKAIKAALDTVADRVTSEVETFAKQIKIELSDDQKERLGEYARKAFNLVPELAEYIEARPTAPSQGQYIYREIHPLDTSVDVLSIQF